MFFTNIAFFKDICLKAGFARNPKDREFRSQNSGVRIKPGNNSRELGVRIKLKT